MELKCCPIENALRYIGKKWTINLVRDMFMGKTRFKEFLESNKELSTKMLSARLNELEENKVIEKRIVSTNPVKIEYHLTEKGKALGDILAEFAMFSFKECPNDVMKKKCGPDECYDTVKKTFKQKKYIKN